MGVRLIKPEEVEAEAIRAERHDPWRNGVLWGWDSGYNHGRLELLKELGCVPGNCKCGKRVWVSPAGMLFDEEGQIHSDEMDAMYTELFQAVEAASLEPDDIVELVNKEFAEWNAARTNPLHS